MLKVYYYVDESTYAGLDKPLITSSHLIALRPTLILSSHLSYILQVVS
jgi:hypothetical protein